MALTGEVLGIYEQHWHLAGPKLYKTWAYVNVQLCILLWVIVLFRLPVLIALFSSNVHMSAFLYRLLGCGVASW